MAQAIALAAAQALAKRGATSSPALHSTHWEPTVETIQDAANRYLVQIGGRAALPAALAAVQDALKPAEPDARAKCIAAIGVLPSATLDAETSRLALAVYNVALDDVPLDLLRLATDRAIRRCTFRPTPAELRALIAPEWNALRHRKHMAELAMDAPEPVSNARICTPEEAAAILKEAGL